MFKRFFVIFVFFFFLFPSVVFAEKRVSIYFFHSDTCSHCKEEGKILDRIEDIYKNVDIYKYEIHKEKNISIYEQVKKIYNVDLDVVPITVIGDKVYVGYNGDRSIVKFVKTIDYYSIYPYQDRVKGVIDSDYESVSIVSKDVPSLEEFMSEYKNYSLFGLKIDDMDVANVSVFLGIISCINIVSLVSVIILFIVLSKIDGIKNKFLLLIFYILFLLLFRINSVFRIEILSYVIYFVLFILFMVNIFKYFRKKKREYIISSIIIVLSLLVEYFSNLFYGDNIVILKSVSRLHLLSSFDNIMYYGYYFFSRLMFYILFILGIYLFFQKKIRKN